MTDDELDSLVTDVRRSFGDRFPVPTRDESSTERDLREEITRDLLDRVVLRKGLVVVLPEGRWTFLPMALLASLVMLPVWPLYKLYRSM